ncbi:MAG: TIGR01777 family oxidoreductase [Oligoflexus sp.]
MRILLTGATGFVGQSLARQLILDGHELVVLSRHPQKVARTLGVPCQAFAWQATDTLPPKEAFQGVDGVINMMGESLASGRWTSERKTRIYDSRVLGTRHLVHAIDRYCEKALQFFMSFSAIGYYPDHASTTWNEDSPTGSGFLAEVCRDWEAEAKKLKQTERTIILRLGTVLGYHGGALQKLLPIFKLGVGGPIGQGQQWMSWIHIDDLVKLVTTAVTNRAYIDVINAVAPEPVTNRVFSQVIARILHRPVMMSVPAPVMKLAMGEMSQIVLDSQRIVSRKLSELGFRFLYANIDHALAEACGFVPVGLKGEKIVCDRIESWQFLPQPIEEVFEFFCNPYNLQKITPPMLNFAIQGNPDQPLKEGSQINYRLKVHGFPMRWKTLITEWEANSCFIDFQLSGPYKIWHHQHRFYPIQGGTLMMDRVDYRLPFGYFGYLFGHALVQRDVNQIFRFRFDNIEGELTNYIDLQKKVKNIRQHPSVTWSALSS